ncbi:MAG: HAMP domain-containing sensor histidine kinase, partial [Flavobacteriales bacterium]
WKTTLFTLSISLSIILVFVIYYIRKRKKIRQILEWKVYKRTNELRDLNSELNTYIYKSSHDLRNPLTSIKSLITLLKTETNPTQLLKYTTLIESCANQMDEILLNLSRAVDYKKIEPKIEQINFSDIKNNLDFTSNSDKTKGLDISWHIREKAPFFSDPSLIGVILKKTILNSMQYRLGSSSDYCKISITTDSSGASVCIEDNGQGIATKVKDSVFDMFVKGTHKSKGAGLGLYLVKIASDKLRGKISLESEESKGAKLVFNLPNLT